MNSNMKKSINLEESILTLPDDKYEELERLSALGYSEADMAMYFDVPRDDFSRAALDPESKINYHIRRGVLMSGALEQMGLLSDAEKGNVQAIQMLYKVRYRRQFEVAKREILYNLDIDEKEQETICLKPAGVRKKEREMAKKQAEENRKRRKEEKEKKIKHSKRVFSKYWMLFFMKNGVR